MDPLTIYHGNCLDVLAGLPEGSVDCVVTSPPFLWLRDYGIAPVGWPEVSFVPMTGLSEVVVPAQEAVLGLEDDPLAYVGHLVAVFREVRRVLKPAGTAWVELGDGYAQCGGPGHQGKHGQRADRRHTQLTLKRSTAHGLKPKDLIGTPWRMALALQADGWFLRQEIVWHKLNPMPESCKDRPTRSHSTVFLLAKSRGYYFDGEAIAEEVSPLTHARMAQDIEAQAGSAKANGGTRSDRPMKCVAPGYRAPGVNPKAMAAALHNQTRKDRAYAGQKALPTEERNGMRPRTEGTEGTEGTEEGEQRLPRGWQVGPGAHDALPQGNYRESQRAPRSRQNPSFSAAVSPRIVDRRNSRSVWPVPIHGYDGKHYATFTREIPRRCILAGCPVGGVVLDPFGGSGTTGQVALELGRLAVLIEAKAEYCELARERCDGVQLGLL